jgi:hypothetical protein
MGTLGQDIHFALRNLRKNPSFAIIAAVTLALGIGASTAIFSVIENVLMEPFPYTDPARLVSVQIHDTERFDGRLVTPGTFEFLGMPALLGRVAQPADYEPGAPPVFVMRYKTWVTRFNAEPRCISSLPR